MPVFSDLPALSLLIRTHSMFHKKRSNGHLRPPFTPPFSGTSVRVFTVYSTPIAPICDRREKRKKKTRPTLERFSECLVPACCSTAVQAARACGSITFLHASREPDTRTHDTSARHHGCVHTLAHRNRYLKHIPQETTNRPADKNECKQAPQSCRCVMC